MSEDIKISIVIPAHNEEANIEDLLDRLNKVKKEGWEVIVVDDGSNDRTASIAGEKGAIVVSHPYPMGNGAAIKSGMRRARGKVWVTMDGDGQHNPEDIPRLIEEMNRYDMVVGARNWGSHSGFHRGIANIIYNILATYVTHKRIPDLTSGFRAVKGNIAHRYIYMLPNSFSYPATLTLALMKSGHSVTYMPIKAAKRKGKSKISLVRDGVRFLLIISKIATMFSPFRVFLPISTSILLTGIGYYLYTFVTQRRFTNMALLLLLLSVIVFLMGLISEQINQLRYDRTEDLE